VAPTDRWAVMLLHLAGLDPPSFPDLPARCVKALPLSDDDPYADEWDRRRAGPFADPSTTTGAEMASESNP
jgi:hypothetical protein